MVGDGRIDIRAIQQGFRGAVPTHWPKTSALNPSMIYRPLFVEAATGRLDLQLIVNFPPPDGAGSQLFLGEQQSCTSYEYL